MLKQKFNKLKTLKLSLVFLLIIPICLFFTACNKNLSAYELAVKNGFNGTEIEWLNSLKTKTAYELAVENGFEGTEQEWLDSLKGESAYELAVKNGFKGTEQEWLDSLQGKNGKDGQDASQIDTYDAYIKAKENNEISSDCTYIEFLKNFLTTSSNLYDYATANKNLMSVVSVYAYTSANAYSSSTSGSGVIFDIDENGNAYIITNHHVTSKDSSSMYPYYKLYLFGQDEFIPATFVGASRSYDIAILKVTNSELLLKSNAQKVEFRNYDAKLAETCYAIGDTQKAGITLTKGVISVERETILMKSYYYSEIRHDSYINHGNSGGGLFDSNGYLIGITNGGVDNTLMNYAIPATVVKPLCENIINNYEKYNKDYATIFLTGIEDNLESIKTISIYDSDSQTIEIQETVSITKIDSNSLFANQNKLSAGDIIESITYNGKLYKNIKTYTLKELLLSSKSGDEITLKIKRVENNDGNEVVSNFDVSIVLNENYLTYLK